MDEWLIIQMATFGIKNVHSGLRLPVEIIYCVTNLLSSFLEHRVNKMMIYYNTPCTMNEIYLLKQCTLLLCKVHWESYKNLGP